jgi:hypothetical protein
MQQNTVDDSSKDFYLATTLVWEPLNSIVALFYDSGCFFASVLFELQCAF